MPCILAFDQRNKICAQEQYECHRLGIDYISPHSKVITNGVNVEKTPERLTTHP